MTQTYFAKFVTQIAMHVTLTTFYKDREEKREKFKKREK